MSVYFRLSCAKTGPTIWCGQKVTIIFALATVVAMLHVQMAHSLSLNDVADTLRNHSGILTTIRHATGLANLDQRPLRQPRPHTQREKAEEEPTNHHAGGIKIRRKKKGVATVKQVEEAAAGGVYSK